MIDEQEDSVPLNALTATGFVGANYPQAKRTVLLNGLRSLRRIQANRSYEDWLCVLQAFTVLTEEVVDELKIKGALGPDVDFRSVDVAKGSPFQRTRSVAALSPT